MNLPFKYLLIALAILIFCYLIPYIQVLQNSLKIIDLRVYDSFVNTHYNLSKDDSKGVYDDICIVDIDEQSISELGQFSSWPSLYFADCVNVLAADKPLAIAFDVFFTESDSIKGYARTRLLQELNKYGGNQAYLLDHISTDANFAKAMESAGNVYLAMFNSDFEVPSVVLPSNLRSWKMTTKNALTLSNPHPPIKTFSDVAYGVGFAHVHPDESGTIHDYPLFLSMGYLSYVNFSMQMCLDLLNVNRIVMDKSCRLYSGNSVIRDIPLSPDGRMFFKYYGPQKSFRYIPFSDVLMERLPPGYFKDRIILIGSSAAGLRDIKSTPLEKNFPGVELHATFIRNLIDEDFISWLSPWFLALINIILLFGMAFLIPRTKPLVSITVFLVLSFISMPLCYGLYAQKFITFSYTTIYIPWVLGFMALFFTQAHEQGVEKRKVRNAFEHYVSRDVISQIMKGSQSLSTGGEKKTISILFADVRNFTSLCEKLSPTEITSFMNHYFNLTTEVITDNRGLLDKYIGDAILALFGAPVAYEGFEANAVKSAITIRNISFIIQKENETHPILSSFRIGVGVATGDVIVGNIGSDTIFNYTGLGDRMNFSSRLEALNKVYHTSIIIDEQTHEKVQQKFFCRKLDRVKVKGKAIESDIYEVVDSFTELPPDSKLITTYRLYETALALMSYDHHPEAKELFQAVLKEFPHDEPSKIMLNRIDTVDWNTWKGVWQYDSK